MTDAPDLSDDDDALAAELALGLLDGAARDAALLRQATDPKFAAAVARWQENLAPMADALSPVAPHPATKAAVQARLFGNAAAPGPARLGWRGVVLGAALGGALAAAAMLAVLPRPPADPGFVAELGGEGLRLVAAFDPGQRVLRLNRVDGAAAPGRALELWLIAGTDAPVSLGVLGDARASLPVPAALADRLPGATLAISDEPLGGSPTGQPTGVVLAAGIVTPL